MTKWGNIGMAIYRILGTDSDVTDIYSTRIFPITFNTNTTTYPAVVYTITNIEPTNTKGNAAQGKSKLDVYDCQIALFHETYNEMINGMEVVRDTLDYKQETTITIGDDTVYLQAMSLKDSRQDFIENNDNSLWVAYLDFNIRQKIL